MRRWDALTETYIKECVARGLSVDYVFHMQTELERWGNWLKRRRPKPFHGDI